MPVALDEKGLPVYLANVAPSGVSRVDPNAKSGNPRHDTSSGKFGAGGGRKKGTVAPPNVDRAAYGRMLDAVKEAARRFPGGLTPENIQTFIAEKAKNPNAVNMQAFLAAAAQQQISDVVEILSPESTGPKLSAPRGYVQKVLKGLSDDDVTEIIQRLAAMTKDEQKAARLVLGKAPKEHKEKLEKTLAATDFENDWAGLELDDDDSAVEE